MHGFTGTGPILVLAAHPDDEAAGAGGWIARCAARGQPPHVLFLTDGAPRQRRYFAHGFRGSRAEYRRRRRTEARAAATALGLPSWHLRFARIPDLELSARLPQGMAHLRTAATATGARIWLVPAGENGHPDHDAANHLALCAHQEWARGAALWEYPLYAWHRGRIRYGWLPPGPDVVTLVLTAAEQAAKARALAAYTSQQNTLAPFWAALGGEHFRPLRRRAARRSSVWAAWGWQRPAAVEKAPAGAPWASVRGSRKQMSATATL
ncbi:MAG: PIG-L deacetylase family protein [Terriglobales bacterium]